MTLILSAVTKDVVVIAADGAEFRHNPGKPTFMEVTNRRKLFPLLGRSVVFAVHGQNRLTTVSKGLDSQRLVGDILDDLGIDLAKIPTVKGIARKLIDLLTPDITHTFSLLQSCGIHQSPLGICVFGFDLEGGRTQGFEAFWPTLTGNGIPQVAKPIQDLDDVRITHSGTGAIFVQSVVNNPDGNYSPDHLTGASTSQVQKYVRDVYHSAYIRQPSDSPVFGGDYHELTIIREQWSWTTPSV